MIDGLYVNSGDFWRSGSLGNRLTSRTHSDTLCFSFWRIGLCLNTIYYIRTKLYRTMSRLLSTLSIGTKVTDSI